MRDHPAPSWAEAAAQADFPVYTVQAPTPERTAAGGFGFSGDETVSLEVIVNVGEAQVSVESHLLSQAPPPGLRLRILVHDLLSAALPFDEAPLTLPLSFSIDQDDRVISVDGRPVTFRGVRLDKTWAGTGEVDDRIALRIVERGSANLSAVAVLKDRGLPEHHLD